jgi:hypothetical protein
MEFPFCRHIIALRSQPRQIGYLSSGLISAFSNRRQTAFVNAGYLNGARII